MQLVFYEDELTQNFTPIALTRPVFELLCGHNSLRERLVKSFSPKRWGAFVRQHLQGVYQEQHPEAVVNSLETLENEQTLFVNGRFLPNPEQLAELAFGQVGIVDDTVVAFWVDGDQFKNLKQDSIQEFTESVRETQKSTSLEGCLLNYPWDVINANGQQIHQDFTLDHDSNALTELPNGVAFLGSRDQICISATAHLDPYVVLDARNGPITICKGAVIQAFTRIEGPCYIGPETQLFRANIREDTSIGPLCRIGGEVEASVIHGFANSYHDGFLGHSYVCPWVNMGALTTNSDLKNDYSNVRVAVNGTMVDSGSTKIGCLIGDHTKTAIGTMFNTGTSVGVMSMILPAGELQPKHIPSFARMWHGQMEPITDLESSLSTARTAMARRDFTLSDSESKMYHTLFDSTRAERQAAIEYQKNKPTR